MQVELANAGVEGVAASWSDDPFAEPPCAEWMNMDIFAKRALLNNAVVFVATHGGYGENGELQAFLEDAGIPFTGSNVAASQTCMNKFETALALEPLEAKVRCLLIRLEFAMKFCWIANAALPIRFRGLGFGLRPNPLAVMAFARNEAVPQILAGRIRAT